jgi:hypothetical protein
MAMGLPVDGKIAAGARLPETLGADLFELGVSRSSDGGRGSVGRGWVGRPGCTLRCACEL